MLYPAAAENISFTDADRSGDREMAGTILRLPIPAASADELCD